MGTAEANTANAPTAFVLSLAAGMATCVGASVVFNRRLVKLASKRFLAGSLGLAAGVMIYVSFVEIFTEAIESFSNAGHEEADAYLYGTLSLFGGMLFYKGLDCVVHLLEGTGGHHDVNLDLYDLDEVSPGGGTSAKGDKSLGGTMADETVRSQSNSQSFPREHDVVVELSSGSIIQPSPDLHTMQLRLAGRVQSPQQQHKLENESTAGGGEGADGADGNVKGVTDVEEQTPVQDKELVRMGLMTALAIGIHNFPEGLATFVGTLSDPAVGASLAVAIAIHNIPEGLCVAIPVYYATGNRWKAFGWAFLSGISEPIGAGLGWLILKDKMTDTVYGILFGMVAGMMVIISLQELIPTAVRYDPADKVTTNSIIFGMAVMALSLILFLY